jgi:hypothetical protein
MGPPVVYVTRECGNEYMEGPVVQELMCACGTFAIGLCQDCSRPVCGMHSGIFGDSRFCSEHLSERTEKLRNEENARKIEEKERLRQKSEKFDRERGYDFFKSGAAGRLLREAGVPMVELYDVEKREHRTTFFGVPPIVEWVKATYSGWLLGTFTWRWQIHYREGTASDEKADIPTVLLDVDKVGDRMFLQRVSQEKILDKHALKRGFKPHGYTLRGSDGWVSLRLDEVSDRVKQMAAERQHPGPR